MSDELRAAADGGSLPPRHRIWRRATCDIIKRAGDFLIGVTLLAMAGPLLVLAALAIRCEGTGPILDRRTCLRSDGRRFQILNFRTVLYGADGTPPWAQRPTCLGGFLRWTCIESVPQLLNVLRGEMSFLDRYGRSFSFFQ